MCQILSLLQVVGAEAEAGIVGIEAGVAELEVIKNLPKLFMIINGEQYTILSIQMQLTAYPYFETSRPACSINENLQPLEFFYKTFPRKIIQQIAAETNCYSAQSQQNIENKYPKWVDVTEAELLAFFFE